MNERTFGEIRAYRKNRQWFYEQHRVFSHDAKAIEQLEDDIRSARMWVRDQERKQADNETPELTMT